MFFKTNRRASGRFKRRAFELNDVRIYENGKVIENYPLLKIPTELTLGKIQENFASPETISFWDLPAIIQFLKTPGFPRIRTACICSRCWFPRFF